MIIKTKFIFKDLNASGLTGLGGHDSSVDNDLDLLVEIIGTPAIDTLEILADLKELNIQRALNNLWVATHNEIDDVVFHLEDIERIQNPETGLALDVKGNAGEVYSLLSTALGKNDVTPQLMGLYLNYKDSGKSDLEIAKLILDSQIYKQDALGTSNETFVKQIYKNVLNTTPSFADLMYFTMELDKGTFTQSQLLEAASNLDLTRTNIGLVGMADTGIEYIPLGI